MEKKDASFIDKISVLTSKESYINPKVSPEGYGSFMECNKETVNTTISDPIDKTIELELEKGIEKILEMLKHFKETTDKAALIKYLKEIKIVIQQTVIVSNLAKKHNSNKADALACALYNLKLYKLTNETPLINKEDIKNITYMADELKALNILLRGSKSKKFIIVGIELIGAELESTLKAL